MPTAILLGGTDDHRAVAAALGDRGFEVVLVDPHPTPRARDSVDDHVVADAFDEDLVAGIARARRAEFIMSLCIDRGLRVACRVSERLGLPAPLSAAEVDAATDKELMKSVLRASDIPTASFATAKSLADASGSRIRPPLVVKPADSHGSRGVRFVSSDQELPEAVSASLAQSSSGRLLLEERIEGRELSIDCFIHRGVPTILMISTLRRRFISASTSLITAVESPSLLDDAELWEVERALAAIVAAFELRHGPLLVQLFQTSDGIRVGEFSPRIGGGSKWSDIRRVSGVDIVQLSLSTWLGDHPDPGTPARRCHLLRAYLYGRAGVVSQFSGFEDGAASGTIDGFNVYRGLNHSVAQASSSADRVASIRVRSMEHRELDPLMERGAAGVDVIGTDGNSLLRRDLLSGAWV